MAGQGQGWTTLVSQTGPTPTLANFGLPGPTLASKGWPTLASKGWSARTGQLWPAWDNLGQTETLGGRTSLQTPKTNTTKTDHPQKPTRPKDPKGLARLGRVGFWGVLFLHEVFKLQESYEKNTTKKSEKNKKRRSKTERCRRTKKGKNRVNARRPKNLLRDARGEKNNVFGKSQNGLREGPREKKHKEFLSF